MKSSADPTQGIHGRACALAPLQEKYPQYRSEPPAGPVLAVDVTEVREWSA